MTDRCVKAWLGLGGNIGEVEANMCRALQMLQSQPGIDVESVSSLYATPPWGKTDQPDFLNAAAQIATSLTGEQLLEACLDVEQKLKRERREMWGPRTIDIDILAMEGSEIVSQRLTVPHPRLTERAFALLPLAELMPNLMIADRKVTEWLSEIGGGEIRRLKSPQDWFAV